MSQAIVAQIRSQYPTPLAGSHGLFLIEVAQKLGGGLLKKDFGTFVTLPNGTKVAQDIYAAPPVNGISKCWDILQDGEGAANPVFNPSDDQPESRYYAVGTQPEPQPEPEPGPSLEPRVVSLEHRAEVQQSVNAAQALENKRLDAELGRALNQNLQLAARIDVLATKVSELKIPTKAKGRITIPFLGSRDITLPLE